MQSIKETNLNNYFNLLNERKAENPKVNSHEALRKKEVGEALKSYFGKNLYFLLAKHPIDSVEYALNACKKKNIKKLPYLLGILKNLTK